MYKIEKVRSEATLKRCSDIRKSVFGEEEKADRSLYIVDETDRLEETKNFLIIDNGQDIGTARYTRVNETTVKVQRMAIVKAHRRHGVASKLLNVMEEVMVAEGYRTVILDAASSAKKFYEDNSYRAISAEFYEDDRPHVSMEKLLDQ